MTTAKKIYYFLLSLPHRILPQYVHDRADTERWSIDQFMFKSIIPKLKKSDYLLDAGAGSGRYRDILTAHSTYVATDFEQIFDSASKEKMDFVCSLDDIPQPDNTYDIVVNMQVLEHVEYPQKVVNELYRVLKPGGTLYLTTNQMFPIHAAPHNYFYFTRFGLHSLFTHAGFTDIHIESRGGFFFLLSKMMSMLPSMLYYQTVFTKYKVSPLDTPKLRRPILAILLLAPYMIAEFFIGRLLAFVLFYLDGLDTQRSFTLGYACAVTKPK